MAILLRRLNLESASLGLCMLCAFADIGFIFFVGFTCQYLFEGVFPTYDRTFRCDDESIMKPFKPNTITVRLLLLISTGFPMFCCVLLETVTMFCRPNRADIHWFKMALANWTYIFLEYLIGFLVLVAMMLVGKSWFGVLRPHFLDVCKLNLTTRECAGKLLSISQCSQTNMRILNSARHSFPSGHSAAAVYSLAFLVLYFKEKVSHPVVNKYRTILTFTQLFYALWAVFCCISRMTDYWHHPSDVIGGIIQGLAIASLIFLRQSSAIHSIELPRD